MEEIIRNSFLLNLFATLFVGVCFAKILYGTIKKTRETENSKARTAIRACVCTVLVSLWIGFFLWHQLYPISLAYYEYNNDLTKETTGVIEEIEILTKERMRVRVNCTDYTMAYNSTKIVAGVGASSTKIVLRPGASVGKGDTATIRFGQKSMYIFDVYEVNS